MMICFGASNVSLNALKELSVLSLNFFGMRNLYTFQTNHSRVFSLRLRRRTVRSMRKSMRNSTNMPVK